MGQNPGIKTRAVLRLVWPFNGILEYIRDLWRRSSILQQPARDRIATAAKPVAASRLWSAMPIKRSITKLISTAHIIGSCAEQYGEMSSDTQTHSH